MEGADSCKSLGWRLMLKIHHKMRIKSMGKEIRLLSGYYWISMSVFLNEMMQ